jgi:aldose 1-epimerase
MGALPATAIALAVGFSTPGCVCPTTGSSATTHAAGIEKRSFGVTKDGQAVDQYILTNGAGASVSLITYGATVTNLVVPDKDGHFSDIVLGFDNIGQYEMQGPYFGAIIGRIGNRIAKGTFAMDKTKYYVPVNNGPNHLHGGFKGYDKRIWKAETEMTTNGPGVRFTLTDPDGTEGYPGTLNVTVIYSLTSGKDKTDGAYSGLKIEYYATTDKATPVNLTNHTYFNLKDGGNSTVLDHVLKIYGDHYTPVDDTLIPTGEIAPVKGTAIDFTSPKPIGRDMAAMGGDPTGYDHNLVLTNQTGDVAEAAQVYEPTTGRLMDVWTNQPGVQFYTGNFLDGSFSGKGGAVYKEHNAFCLETQNFPDAINHTNFPEEVLKPGETYRQVTEYRIFTPAKAPW